MPETFEERNLAGAMFRNVNLHQAQFEDVNLAEATIRNANLANLNISDANIFGLTVDGFRVDELIEAELDRRDPERARLRPADPHDPEAVRQMMAHLDELRRQFYLLLRTAVPTRLWQRPARETWSALEHARHLLFSEEHYLKRLILRSETPLSALGQLPTHLQDVPTLAQVGSEASNDLEAILAAWDAIHAQTHAFVKEATAEALAQMSANGQETVGEVLQGLPRHDLDHIRQVEELLAD